MPEIPPREPNPEEEYQLSNIRRIELLVRIVGDRIPPGKIRRYLSEFSSELLVDEEKLADVAELVEEHLWEEVNEDDLDRPIAEVDNLNETEVLEHPSLFVHFKSKVSAIRALAVALQIEGIDPRQASREALLDGLAEYLSLSDEAPPEFLRFRVEGFRQRRDAGQDFEAELAADTVEMKGNPPDGLLHRVTEDDQSDLRFTRRRVEAHIDRLIADHGFHVETAPLRAKQILRNYSDLDKPLDLILGAKGGRLPL